MKKFTKLLSISTIATLGLALGACGSGADDDGIVLRYANWNLGTEEENNLERQMIAAFEEAHPNIKIEVDESIPAGDWMENLSIAASTGDLPDVFMISDTGTSLANDWLLDITEMAHADTEFMNLPNSIHSATQVNDSIYNIPFGQAMMGFYVNRDLFNDLNLDAPEFGFSVDELFDGIRATTDLNRPIIGVNELDEMPNWYPGVMNSEMGFFTFDGENFHLDSDEMHEAIRLANELTTNGFSFGGLTDEQREVFNTDDSAEAFRNGQMGLFYQGSWMNTDFAQNTNIDWDFIGIPGGRSVITFDVLGIAQTSEHPEEAYKFAKWMGFGTEGYLTRIELATEMGGEINSLPVTTDEQVLAAYWELVDVPGLVLAYENLDDALIDGNKVLPGWIEARFDAPTGAQAGEYDNATMGQFIWHSIRGNVNFADYATRLNELAQDSFERALDALQ